jgi:hypothetical protein
MRFWQVLEAQVLTCRPNANDLALLTVKVYFDGVPGCQQGDNMSSMGSGEMGGSTPTAVEAEGRDEFVQRLVSDFETHRMGVDLAVVGYILGKVLEPEEKWQAGLEAGRIDLDKVTRLLRDSLALAADRAEASSTRLVVDLSLAKPALYEVIHGYCDFPFLIC